jgi:hypothetical protein
MGEIEVDVAWGDRRTKEKEKSRKDANFFNFHLY